VFAAGGTVENGPSLVDGVHEVPYSTADREPWLLVAELLDDLPAVDEADIGVEIDGQPLFGAHSLVRRLIVSTHSVGNRTQHPGLGARSIPQKRGTVKMFKLVKSSQNLAGSVDGCGSKVLAEYSVSHLRLVEVTVGDL
jgi:hypothetical protein